MTARSSGSRSLRAMGRVSFKEDSDGGGSEDESGSESDGDDVAVEVVIDQTLYEPPPEAALPAEVTLRPAPAAEEGGPPGPPGLTVPSDVLGDLLAAYNVLRAFSWQLRLSPFPFDDFCAAMESAQVRQAPAALRQLL